MFWKKLIREASCSDATNTKIANCPKLNRDEANWKRKRNINFFGPKFFTWMINSKYVSIFQWGLLRNLNLLNFIHRQVIVNITNPSVLRERFISRVNSIQPSTGALDSFEGSRRTILDKSLLPSSSFYEFHADAVVSWRCDDGDDGISIKLRFFKVGPLSSPTVLKSTSIVSLFLNSRRHFLS